MSPLELGFQIFWWLSVLGSFWLFVKALPFPDLPSLRSDPPPFVIALAVRFAPFLLATVATMRFADGAMVYFHGLTPSGQWIAGAAMIMWAAILLACMLLFGIGGARLWSDRLGVSGNRMAEAVYGVAIQLAVSGIALFFSAW